MCDRGGRIRRMRPPPPFASCVGIQPQPLPRIAASAVRSRVSIGISALPWPAALPASIRISATEPIAVPSSAVPHPAVSSTSTKMRQIRNTSVGNLDDVGQPGNVSSRYRRGRHSRTRRDESFWAFTALRPLFHELLARAKCDCPRLLVRGFRRDEAHGRTLCGTDNRIGVICIILLSLDERLHVVRHDQPNLMSIPCQFHRPVARAGTRVHRDHAGLMLRHEPYKLLARKLLAERDGPVSCGAM